MGFEPTTFCLGSKHSATELRPLGESILGSAAAHCQRATGGVSGSEAFDSKATRRVADKK